MGPYLCIASNGVPPAVSKRIVLNVYFQPMIWIENQLVGAYEGQTLVLECHSEAYPTAITYWTRPSNETITNENYKVETIPKGYEINMRLTIKSVQPQDFGSYRCVAKNSLGEMDGKIKLYRIDRSPTMRRPSNRRDSKKMWKMEHSHERNATGMRDEPMSKGVENDDEQIDFQSAADSSHRHYRLFSSLGITAITAILAGCLST
ncbi:lachesin-like [Frieseomelitta varia]|uniref:lachesin-like n=1 Tax=Frieseomelitta varia TaxID=561572 RepID=UPI001CB6AC0C|nr:lachesin-like [Frieseomelitta varia]